MFRGLSIRLRSPDQPEAAHGWAEQAADLAVHRATRVQRDTPRWAQAAVDNKLKLPKADEIFSCTLAMPISAEATPHLTGCNRVLGSPVALSLCMAGQVGAGGVFSLGEEGRGVLLNQAVQRDLFRAVALVVDRSAIRRPLGLPANGLHARLPRW